MAIIRFKGSKSLRARKKTIKNIGKVKAKAILIVKNILNIKKKNKLIITFINIIIKKLEGVTKKAKEIITPKIISKKISFFGKTSLASLISFYYNRKLWLK
ncbi:MAG: hypothetical protein UR54_C0016G0004 [Candidatus Roizmanbacteria bacterium GW2011_GWA2_34_18]|uniref:Uncharacterized protein n=1 Tax=Candidatus Roizmanbacteria bacterium GW2011_GWA2_34_18 TaxID=1618477 RepID=A0A0G0ATN0_9BACT|nr:MAG: hypothetical protein UR54_C0016G0004 [Candidatus Roizmanbacteria bacterium GW2011_GWA2_34_18]